MMIRHFLPLPLSLGCLFWGFDSFSEPSPFAPNQYLDEKAFDEAGKAPKAEAIKQNVVQIGGRPYYKFGDGKRSILVPKTDHLTRQDMERALCNEDLKSVCDPGKGDPEDEHAAELCRTQGLSEALGAKVEQELTKDTSLYLDWIVSAMQTSCGGDGHRPNAAAMRGFLEVGVERKSKDPRHPGSEKVFIRPSPTNPLTPVVGGGVSF